MLQTDCDVKINIRAYNVQGMLAKCSDHVVKLCKHHAQILLENLSIDFYCFHTILAPVDTIAADKTHRARFSHSVFMFLLADLLCGRTSFTLQ